MLVQLKRMAFYIASPPFVQPLHIFFTLAGTLTSIPQNRQDLFCSSIQLFINKVVEYFRNAAADRVID